MTQATAGRSAVTATSRIPLNTLAVALGVAGVAETWSAASAVVELPPAVPQVFWGTAAVAMVWLITAHVVRGIRVKSPLKDQLRHPAQGPLAAIVPVIGMLLGSDLVTWSPVAGTVLVLVSLTAASVFAGWLVSTWTAGHIELGALHGGYLLPTVAGGFVAASAADAIGLRALGWAAFGVASLFWVVMTTLLIARLISRPPLPDALVPTLAVVVAPPAVGGLALFALTDHVSTPLSLAFAGLTAILAMAQIALIPRYRRLSFTLGFWSFTFPVAAVVSYTITWLGVGAVPGAEYIALVLAVATTVFVAWIGVRSLAGILGARARRHEEAVLTDADDANAAMTHTGALAARQ
ncbi:transporter [Promicromonospora sp. NPDC090134]|uniref:SLAC1 family transporter n=1 Tax=Promicromonospora sp. NPDC090134 TaxID=3364408 RepID=UPI0038070E00